MRCNEQWDLQALERTRALLPPYGPGTQSRRKEFVRSCTTADGRLHIKDGLNTLPVCWEFFRALHGVSNNLLRSAAGVGPVAM